jgi:folate-binding protein YgfZ
LQVLIFNRFTINILFVTKFPLKVSIYPFHPACLLHVEGPDAADFLQGQFSNDLSGLGAGQARYGLWLDRKGRVIADSHVVRDPSGGYWVASEASPGPVVLKRLEDFVIADDVVLRDETAGWSGLALVGEGAGSWLAAEPRQGFCFSGRRCGGENWAWLLPAQSAASADAAVDGAPRLLQGDIERMRVDALIPWIPVDIGPADLPNEGGLEASALSYSKGCYLGQEVMARLKTRGTLRRRLVRVAGAGDPPVLPAGLWVGDALQGQLRSAVSDPDGRGYAGLAMLSASSAGEGTQLSLSRSVPPSLRVSRVR